MGGPEDTNISSTISLAFILENVGITKDKS